MISLAKAYLVKTSEQDRDTDTHGGKWKVKEPKVKTAGNTKGKEEKLI